MSRYVLLDTGPLGLACCQPGSLIVDRCRAWLAILETAGVEVLVPAVADYETRRELVRLGATTKLRNLDILRARFAFVQVSAEAWDWAAYFWAVVRQAGQPTAGDADLDPDAMLAGMAATLFYPGDAVTIATSNRRHFSRFPGIDAQEWEMIN